MAHSIIVHTVVRQFAHVPMQLPTCYMRLAIHSSVTCRSGPIDARGLHFHSTFRPSEPSLSSGLSLIEETLLHVLVIKVMRTLSREHAPLRTASFGLSTCTFHIYSSWPRASLVCTHAHLLSTRDALHHVVPPSPQMLGYDVFVPSCISECTVISSFKLVPSSVIADHCSDA